MRRERHSFFLCWLFHLTPPRAAHFVDPNWSRRGETKNRLHSSRLESQLTVFFQIPQILSASGHDVIHFPGPISYLGFLLWHLWLSHPPRAHMNTCTQCVHLTYPCTKRKVLSLNNLKGKIYKTKNHNIIKKKPYAIISQLDYNILMNEFQIECIITLAKAWTPLYTQLWIK